MTGITPALSRSASEAAMETLHRASAAGSYISFDVNYRSRLWGPEAARVALQPFLSADLVFATVAEARLMLGMPADTSTSREVDALGLVTRLHELGGAAIVLKCGRDDAVLLTAEGAVHTCAVPRVSVLDTVGAGDAFVGGFLSALLTGATPHACLDQAVRAGSYAVTVPGDSEVLARPADLNNVDSDDPDLR